MKLTVIGGGGVRSMFLAKSLVQKAKSLGINEIIFMDTDEAKLNIYGKMAQQTAKRIDESIKFGITTDAIEAVKDADYLITTIRMGGDQKRIDDEKIALSYGVLGQETTGAAGFSFAMRSIPALVEYCELIKKYAKPGAKMFNFTNPAGVVSQTLRDLGYDFTFGICDAPSGLLHEISKIYDVSQDRLTGECFGLNHLSFIREVKLDGKDILAEIIDNERLYQETEMKYFDKSIVKKMNHLLNEYLYYFYYPEQAVANIKKAGITRGEVIKEVNIGMTKELSRLDVEGNFEECLHVFETWYGKREAAYMANETGLEPHRPPFKFDIFEEDTGGYAGVALKYIEVELSGESADMILCVPNQGALSFLKDTDVIEVTCTISKKGYKTHKFNEVDDLPMEIIRRVKIYERLASEAIREKNIDKAVECLMVHPLVNSYSRAKSLVEEYLISNKEFIGEWN